MATAAEYRRLLVAARKRQLRLTSQQVGRLLDVYTNAANSLADQLTNVPEAWLTGGGAIEQGYLRILLANMNKTILATAQDYQSELNGAMLTLAQDAADREQRVEQLSGVTAARDPRLAASMTTTVHLTSGASVNVAFGEVAQTAVQGVAQRYYSDGLKLSDRLYQLTTETQKIVEDTIIQGIAEQVSARELADRLKGQLAAAGSENPTFHAMRIARTEINTAHREAHIRSTLGPSGVMKPYIQGVRWNLSQSHPAPDICDVWAGADVDGLGPGLYLPSSVPSDHPHGLCYTTSELKAFPGVGMGKEPDLASVPSSQIARYARDGDQAAGWAQAQGIGTILQAPSDSTLTQLEDSLRQKGISVRYGSIGPTGLIQVPSSEDSITALQALNKAADYLNAAGYTVGQPIRDTARGMNGRFLSQVQVLHDPSSEFSAMNLSVREIMFNTARLPDERLQLAEDAAAVLSGKQPLFNQIDIPDVWIHESGHQLMNALPLDDQNAYMAEWRALLGEGSPDAVRTAPSMYATENELEGFAEAFVSIVRNRKYGGPLRDAVRTKLASFHH